jgi:peptidoglycan hydrolase-like amidase
MKKHLNLFISIIAFGLLLITIFFPVQAFDKVEELQNEIDELQNRLEMSRDATEPLEAELARLQQKLENIRAGIKQAEQQQVQLEQSIKAREKEFAEQYAVLAERAARYYKTLRGPSKLLVLLSAESASTWTKDLAYRNAVTQEDKKMIAGITQDLMQLEKDKKQLEQDKQQLAAIKQKTDEQAAFFRQEIKGAKEYQAELDRKIEELSRRQKEILAARSGTFTTSVGNVPDSSIPCSGPPGTPSYCDPGGGTWFAAFSFGAWTHRKGMSQYGAKARAESGQNYKDILKAYYGKEPVSKDTGGNISVQGFGELNFEDYYLMGIAEMPSSWPEEALKAQAIAARTYAYRYKKDGKAICTTQSCQVFNNGKAASPPEDWKKAVQDTKGEVLEDVTTYYSSTTGGYLTTHAGWDTECGNQGCWPDQAWEVKAESPWFYSAWYTDTYNPNSAKCNRGNPWLSSEEMADILNAWRVLQQENDERILPVTINQCPIDGAGGDPYSVDELRNKAEGKGGGFNSVSGVSVSYGDNGETSSLTFSTNKGSVSISGADFKKAFNLRAPGYIAIRSPLFNLEKK